MKEFTKEKDSALAKWNSARTENSRLLKLLDAKVDLSVECLDVTWFNVTWFIYSATWIAPEGRGFLLIIYVAPFPDKARLGFERHNTNRNTIL